MRVLVWAAFAGFLGASCGAVASEALLPPWLEDRLVYYHSFEQAEPDINTAKAAQRGRIATGPHGIRGRCAAAERPQCLQLRSPAFSPHGPLTVAFWWALQEDAKVDSIFGLFQLSGPRGFVSPFSRGKGQWCALERPAGILQVYRLPGIRNVNGIYDRDWRARVELKAGVWHHAAIVFRGASLVEVYTDGQRAWAARLVGRSFAEADRLHDLALGNRGGIPMALDEVIILRRALTADEIRTYVTAVRQMHAVSYP